VARKSSKFITPERLLPALRAKRERGNPRDEAEIGLAGRGLKERAGSALRLDNGLRVHVRAGGTAGGSGFGDLAPRDTSPLTRLRTHARNDGFVSIARQRIGDAVLSQLSHAAAAARSPNPDPPAVPPARTCTSKSVIEA